MFDLTLFYPNTFLNLKLEYNISSLLHKIIIQMVSFRWQNKTIQYHIVFHQTCICLQNETDRETKNVNELYMVYTLFWINLKLPEMFVILGLRFYRNGQWNTDLNWLFLLLLQTVNVTFPVQLCYSKNQKHDLKWILLFVVINRKNWQKWRKGNFLTELIRMLYVSIICSLRY